MVSLLRLPTLLPAPRQVTYLGGECSSHQNATEQFGPNLTPSQGYILALAPQRISLTASDEAGQFYARQTLAQLRSTGEQVPCCIIEDHPDFAVRGVMLDISRDKVPTLATLEWLIDLLASWKINQLQLYMEHTFAYSGHETVWQHASPLTASDIEHLDAYCRARHIDLVPNQNSFGHMERWMKQAKYRHLAEAPEGAPTPWGYTWKGPFSLCPTDPASLALLSDLYAQLLPNFSSTLFNVGCDETFDIGQGRSHARAAEIGKHRVYLEFLQKVHALVHGHGRQMMFWGDIILHSPELIPELPKDAIALEWGYEADHPFDKDAGLFAQAGIPFYVCPGTSSWLSIAGRTDNMIANQIAAARAGLAHGAAGFLNTDWGDHGHLQYLPASLAGFAMGAAVSWCLENNRDIDLSAALTAHAFANESLSLAKVWLDLGNVYQACGKLMPNASALFRMLVPPPTGKNPLEGLTIEALLQTERAIFAAVAPIEGSSISVREAHNAAAMLRHACWHGRWKLGDARITPSLLSDSMTLIIETHQSLWLARNRPGGLADSLARLGVNLKQYDT